MNRLRATGAFLEARHERKARRPCRPNSRERPSPADGDRRRRLVRFRRVLLDSGQLVDLPSSDEDRPRRRPVARGGSGGGARAARSDGLPAGGDQRRRRPARTDRPDVSKRRRRVAAVRLLGRPRPALCARRAPRRGLAAVDARRRRRHRAVAHAGTHGRIVQRIRPLLGAVSGGGRCDEPLSAVAALDRTHAVVVPAREPRRGSSHQLHRPRRPVCAREPGRRRVVCGLAGPRRVERRPHRRAPARARRADDVVRRNRRLADRTGIQGVRNQAPSPFRSRCSSASSPAPSSAEASPCSAPSTRAQPAGSTAKIAGPARPISAAFPGRWPRSAASARCSRPLLS